LKNKYVTINYLLNLKKIILKNKNLIKSIKLKIYELVNNLKEIKNEKKIKTILLKRKKRAE
jgi:hypothetical protein